MFFKNKHVIASLIIAPILAIISYFAVDYYVAEVPHKAKKGGLYKFLVKPNCRWESGSCRLVNGDIELHIKPKNPEYGNNYIYLKSSVALESVRFALVKKKGDSSQPNLMKAANNTNTLWSSNKINISKPDYLQLAVSVGGSIFHAEVPAIFVYEEELLGNEN